MPDDGSEPPARCVLGALSELLNVSCEVAIVIANIIGLGLLGGFSITGFIIVKRKYVIYYFITQILSIYILTFYFFF